MEDCRVALLSARIAALLSEAARLKAELKATLAVRAAGVSRWGSELPPLFLHKVLQLLQWEPAACGNIRAVCSTWSSIHDALRPGRLRPRGSAVITRSLPQMGMMGFFKSVTKLSLMRCKADDVSGVLSELWSMPSLRSLKLPASCAERAVDAEALCGLTTLTTLRFEDLRELTDDWINVPVGEVGEWVLDMSRLTTLTTLGLEGCWAVTGKEVRALISLTGLTTLSLGYRDDDGFLAAEEALETAMPHLLIDGSAGY
jgi:hypothetical protein